MRKRYTLLLAHVALAALVLLPGACTTQPDRPQEATIKVGAVLPLTGNLARLGEPKKNAILLAVDEINRQGGVDGKQLSVSFEDNKGDPKEGVSAMQKMINVDGIKFFFVDITAVALACVPVAESNKVVMFAGSAHPTITEGSGYVYRVFTSGAQEAELLAQHLGRQATKAVYVLHVDDSLGQDMRKIFEQKFTEAGGRVVGADSFKTGEQDFRPILTKIKGARPEKVAIFDYGVTLPQILKQAHELGIPSDRIAGNIGFVGPGIAKLDAPLREGAVFTGPAYAYRANSESPTDVMRTFLGQYQGSYQQPPDYTAAFAYDTFKILAAAMRGAQGDVERVRQNLLGVSNFPGVTGNISIRPNRDSYTDVVLAVYQGDKIVQVAEKAGAAAAGK